jgi:large subunit ribosomal protein L15
VLSDGDLKAKLSFDIAGASKAAVEKIEKAGGSVKFPEKVEPVKKMAPKAK